MIVKEIVDFESFKTLHTVWDNLIEESATQDVFLTWEWFYAWFKSYGKESSPYILTVWADDQLVGLAPFAIINQRKYKMNFRILRTLSSPQCDVGGFLIKNGETEILDLLIQQLTKKQHEWNVIEFNQYSKNNKETQFIISALKNNGYAIQKISNKHYYVEFTNSWDEYFSKLSTKFRQQIRKNDRELEKMGNYKIHHVKGKDISQDVLDQVIEINRHSSYPFICNSEVDQELHREIIEVMADKNWFDLNILHVNGNPVAYEYGFMYKGRKGNWRVGFDRRNKYSISPGVILMTSIIRNGYSNSQQELDFLRGDEDYKSSWKPNYREFINFKASRKVNFLPALIFIWMPKIKYQLKNFLRLNKKRKRVS